MKVTRELVHMACRAPSIHNTQPWAWRLAGADTIELYADRRRQLAQIDPEGRALAISCGAALHHLVVAAEGFGLVAETHLLPLPATPTSWRGSTSNPARSPDPRWRRWPHSRTG